MREGRMQEWFLWKVLLPYLFLMLMWPVYGLTMQRNDAYEKAFAHGELLIFSALVLIEIGIELKRGDGHSENLWVDLSRIAAIVLIFVFGFLHYAVILREEAKPVSAVSHRDLVHFSCFNCTVAVLALSVSFVAYWKAKDLAMTQKLGGG